MYKVRDRWIHPANMLVLSRDRDRHGDFVHSLSQLPIGSNEARCWKPVRPCIHFKDEDYCVTSGVNTKTRRGKRALFYMPLPTERLLFFKAELALETLFGEDGFVMTKAQAKNIKMKLSIRSCYWPEPMAFVLLECAKQEWENSVALVQDASVEFGQLGEKAKRQCINHGAGRVFTKCCHPKEIAIDEWLCRKPLFARDYDRIFWKDLLVIMRAYLSESAMGYIDNVPKAKKGESLFDALT